MFAVLAVAAGTQRHELVTKDPEKARQLVKIDAARDIPWTPAGDFVKRFPEAAKLEMVVSNVSLQVAIEALHSPKAVPYSTWDDDHSSSSSSSPHKTYPGVRADQHICPWASEDAAQELERLFFCDDEPLTLLEGETAADILHTIFEALCVSTRNHVSHGFVYNVHKRCVVVKVEEPPWFRELPPAEFAHLTLPWLAQAACRVCRSVLAGGRNSTPAFQDPVPIVRQAHEVMRSLHVPINTTATVLDTLLAQGDSLQKLKKRGAAKDVTKLAKNIVNSMREAAKNDSLATFEKLRRIYPKTHPCQPKYSRYRKRISGPPVLDEELLKSVMKRR